MPDLTSVRFSLDIAKIHPRPSQEDYMEKEYSFVDHLKSLIGKGECIELVEWRQFVDSRVVAVTGILMEGDHVAGLLVSDKQRKGNTLYYSVPISAVGRIHADLTD
jgi:hypothetical protein